MSGDGAGQPVLVRAAALPVRFWLMAANPRLFALVRALDERTRAARTFYQRVAETIGERLVPLTSVTPGERRRLLALRRDLHAGRRIDAGEAHLTSAIAAAAGVQGLAADIAACLCISGELAGLEAQIGALVAAEPARLMALPERIRMDSPVAGAVLDGLGSPPAGKSPPRKQRRFIERSSQHITRAATDPTPRGWLSHVGLAQTHAGNRPGEPAARLGRQAFVLETQSVRNRRRAEWAADPLWPRACDSIAANPLAWSEEGEHISIVLDREAQLSCVMLRETDMLGKVLGALGDGPQTFAQLCTELGASHETGETELRAFLSYLRQQGVVEASAAPASSLRVLRIGGPDGTGPQEGRSEDGWTDVYRMVEPGLSAGIHSDLAHRLLAALAILEAAAPVYRATQHPAAGGERWTFEEILKSGLARSLAPQAGSAGGAAAGDEAAPGQDFLDRLLPDVARPAGGVVNLTALRLARIGEARAVWPVDCVVRIAGERAPYRYVLRSVWPAGTIDSRFADGLGKAFGMTHLADAYRGFLRQVEQLTGIAFVEILAPPLSERADNAVRRPAYTSMWTGDPSRDLYLVGKASAQRYLAPGRIEIATGPGGLASLFEGQRIWPVYHATRTCSPPWDHISRMLLATAPIAIPLGYRNPRSLFLQQRARMPRIVIDDLVLCPAQWVILADMLWPADARLAQKLRCLARLRAELGLPRWLEISYPDEVDFVGCDLEGIEAIALIERMAARRGAVRAAEMLPAPDHLFLGDAAHDPADRLVSEIVIRIPGSRDLSHFAEEVARTVAGR